MRIETRYDNAASEFVVTIHYPDGRQVFERFSNLTGFRERLVAFEQQFEADHWTPSGAPLIVPEGFPNRRLIPDLPGEKLAENWGRATIKRTYAAEMRTFEITLLGTLADAVKDSSWTVESVIETSRDGHEISVPAGMDRIVAPAEDVAFARACNCIDKWLLSNP
jgi:hypothetical protein